MKSISSRFLIAALAVVMGSAIARSQTTDTPPSPPPGPHPHAFHRGGPGMEFFSKQLNLTDDQKTQMKAVMEKAHPTMKPLMQQQHQIDLQLRQYVQGPFDQAKVQALANQKAQVQAQLTVAETQVHNQLYQLLTPEQQSQLKEMEANHEARMQKRMSMNEAPPAPPEQ
jgi:protein CpxP